MNTTKLITNMFQEVWNVQDQFLAMTMAKDTLAFDVARLESIYGELAKDMHNDAMSLVNEMAGRR